MRRRRSATGKARKQFWQQEYWNISMSKLISVTQLGTSRFRPVALISSRNRFLNVFFGSVLFTLLSFLSTVSIPAAADSSGAVLLDRVVATVNDEVITWSELRNIIELEGGEILEGVSEGEREKKRRELEKSYLNRMIDMKLQLQEAARLRIEVSDAEAEEAINDIKKKYNMTDEQLNESLKKEGFTLKEYRKNLSEQIILSKIVSMEVRSRVFVSESDIEEYYESNKEKYLDEEKVKIRQIFFSFPEDEYMKSEIETMARDIARKINDGEDFAKLAGEFSEDPNRESGGNLGYIKRGSVMKEVEEVAFALKSGGVSEPFWSPAGLHIVKVEDYIGGSAVKSIRDDISNKLFEDFFRLKHIDWLKKLRENAYIEKNL
jgi:parvulin-like peptidyl-prolyl isomerase